jgi:hypothetical protein
MLNRSFLEPEIGRQLMDPIAAAHALRQNISASANPDVDGVRLERQLYFALPPFHVVRRKNLGQLVRATAYRKTLLTLSTPSGRSAFSIAAVQPNATFCAMEISEAVVGDLNLPAMTCRSVFCSIAAVQFKARSRAAIQSEPPAFPA